MLKTACLALAMFAVTAQAVASDLEYTVIDKPKLKKDVVNKDETLIDWTPMSVEAFGYDVRKVWRFPKDGAWSWSVAVAERLDLLCDVRPHEPPKPEVFTYYLSGFSR